MSQFALPEYQHPQDQRPEKTLPVTPLTSLPIPDLREAENKIGVLITQAMSQPHTTVLAFLSSEDDDIFLEGTGSIVLDRANGKAYCALSPRADEELFIEFCEDFEFTPVIFEAFQTVNGERKHIYHTNVIMCVGETFAVICADCIDDKKERKMVLDSLKGDEKEVILITEDQVNNFAGNMLEVKGNDDRRYLIMSASAHQSLTKKQIAQLEEHVTIVNSSLDTIEACGGGSARCMMAEIFLPRE